MNLLLPEDPYKALGVARTATEAEIKQAYFNLVREHPPERDPQGFKRIRAAYDQLKAARARAQTELFLIEAQPPEASHQSLAPALPSLTRETITTDLLALEAFLLLTELAPRASR
jgi:curved DNA-binding protein CbpA